MTRATELADNGRHLDEQIHELLIRKMQLLQVSGFSVAEGCAVALSAAQRLTYVAMGMWLAQVPERDRGRIFDETLEQLSNRLRSSAPKLMAAVELSDDLMAKHR